MPPDVFLALASSGIYLIASLMFLVAPTPRRPEPDDDPRFHVPFMIPPSLMKPPPLPVRQECTVNVSQPALHAVMQFKLQGEEFVVTLHTAPRADAAALQVADGRGSGAVTDLRWHGKAGLARATQGRWKLKPGRA